MAINGTNGNDVLGKKELGADTLIGKGGDDTYIVNNAGDKVVELANQGIDTVISSVDFVLSNNVEKLTLNGKATSGTGNALDNVIIGSSAVNILKGLLGNDSLYGLAGNDTLEGGEGNDKLYGGLGKDALIGGNGNDAYFIGTDSTDTITELANQGIDSVYSGVQNYTLGVGLENLFMDVGAVTSSGNELNNRIYGNNGNNTINGLAGDDWLSGKSGTDILNGGAGNDILHSGEGGDTLNGGAGNDTYIVETATDKIVEIKNEGIDKVSSSVDYTLGDFVEHLDLRGTAVSGTGNALNNRILGNSADNTLKGLAGNDVLRGNAGSDTLDGGNGNDILDGGEGADTLIGGAGKDTYILTETKHSADTVVIGDNTAPKILSDYLGNTDVVNGFVVGEDKLDTLFTAIVANTTTTPVTGVNSDPLDPDTNFGTFAKHTVTNGIYTLYDAAGTKVDITTANEKNAYAYVLENTPTNGSIAGFHVARAGGQVDTIIMQHDHAAATATTPLIENHIVVNLVGVNAGSLDASWII